MTLNKLTLILFTLLTNLCWGQQALDDFEKDVCKCIEETSKFEELTLPNCLGKVYKTHGSALRKLDKTRSGKIELAREEGFKAGKLLFKEMLSRLMKNCNPLFTKMIDKKKEDFILLKKEYPISLKRELVTKVMIEPNVENLIEVATWHFANEEYGIAEVNYLEAIKLDAENLRVLYLLANLYEHQERYAEAVELYQKLYEKKEINKHVFYLEVAKKLMEK